MIEPGTRGWERLAQRYRYVDAPGLLQLTEAGMIWLKTNQDTVNALNVYPIPDGDTGTNMVLTMEAAWREVEIAGGRSIGKALQTQMLITGRHRRGGRGARDRET